MQSKAPKSGSTSQSIHFIGKPMTVLNEPQTNRDTGPSRTSEGSGSQRADEGCSMSSDSQATPYAIKSASGVLFEQSPLHPRIGARGYGTQTPSIDRSAARPATNWAQSGTGNIGYRAMDKLKQRICDVMSHKKNIGALQTKVQVLMEEVAGVQTLLMSGENDSKDEVHNWFAEADEFLKETNGIQEGRNSMADKKRMCSTCWDPTSSWETGEMLREIDKFLEERKGLDLSSYFHGRSYCSKLQSRESMLQEMLEAIMDIHINIISIYGMIGAGKTILAKELARRAQSDNLFYDIVMVHVSESVDVKLIQSQIANKIGLQLSDDDDEETRAHLLYNSLEEKIMERGHESDTKPVQQSKILVILDGLQCIIEFKKVGIPYRQEERSSCKVVLISRNADVCKKMGSENQFSVECLNLDESKILFQERLGDKIENMEITHERYQSMENVFLIKCGGLPLVIDALACTLRSMSWSNWEITAGQMERYTLVEVDELKVVPHTILDLCNNFIQNGENHKLLLLCCLIQQGMDISVARLVRYGIGLGLFDDDSLVSGMDQIYSWVDELKSLSLLVESKVPQHVMVHDIVQDVAISSLSQGDHMFPVLLDTGTCWHTRESYENCAAISMMPDSNFKCVNSLDLHKLQACLLKGKPSLSLPNHFFQGMRNLKILDISGITFVDFPSSIGDLKNLVTLHLEYCDIKCGFMSTIRNLTKLEVLSLRESSVDTISEEIAKLTNLRVLDLTRCKNLRAVCVDAVAKLDHLRGLYLYDICWEWSTDDIKKLMSFPLEVLEIIIRNFQVSINVLNLRTFVILCIGRYFKIPQDDFISFSRVILVNGAFGLQLPGNDITDLLPWTEFLLIDRVGGFSNGVGDLNIHGFLHLKHLHLSSCPEVKCILDTSNLSMCQRHIFPELEFLALTSLNELTCICHWLPRHSFFPKLRELRLKDLDLLYPYVLPIQLAVKLEFTEASNCGSLLYIFPASDEVNETDHGADLSTVELPCMKTLELKGLKSLLALQDSIEASITRDELGKSHCILFDEKIKLPSLKTLHLEDLHLIGSLCDFSGSKERAQTWVKEPYGRNFCFANLKCMTVSHCHKLHSLLSSQIVNSLLQLEKLEVKSCSTMLDIIRSDIEDDANSTTMITFPKLQTLRLKSLNILQCFYRGRLQLKFPMLRELDLFDLRNMKAFTLPDTQSDQLQGRELFDGEIDFASLVDLQVSCMEIELIKKHGDTAIFPNLLRLTLRDLLNLKYNPSMSLIMSCELEELRLSECNSVEELVDDENSDDNHKQLFYLKKLELHSLGQLKRIPWNMISNLRSLIIIDLKGWISLIPTSLLVGGNLLPLLESIKVEDCESLEAIISWEELQEQDQDFVKYGMTLFPCLRNIQLDRLPKLANFSKGSYEAHFPSLETLEIRECGHMYSFSLGRLRTPRLKSVKLESFIMEAGTFDGLTSAVEAELEAKKGREIKFLGQIEAVDFKDVREEAPDPAKNQNRKTDQGSMLKSVKLDWETIKTDTLDDLNAMMQELRRPRVRRVTPKKENASAGEFEAIVRSLREDFEAEVRSLTGAATEEW